MRNQRERFDSSKTRVVPTFDAISRHPGWLPALLELPRWGAENPRPLPDALDPVPGGCYWGERARGLLPPVSLLSWLVRNYRGPVAEDGSELARARRRLAEGDPEAVENALVALRTEGVRRGWHVLERRSFPDAFVVTPDLLVVIEGKRTESTANTFLPWPAGRHQIWRHLDAAWETRGRREVVGMLIVEGDGAGEVPESWLAVARAAFTPQTLAGSFPHRSPEEREEIVRSFRGVTTWQTVVRRFGLQEDAVLVESL